MIIIFISEVGKNMDTKEQNGILIGAGSRLLPVF